MRIANRNNLKIILVDLKIVISKLTFLKASFIKIMLLDLDMNFQNSKSVRLSLTYQTIKRKSLNIIQMS
jgi:hypothetical protein